MMMMITIISTQEKHTKRKNRKIKKKKKKKHLRNDEHWWTWCQLAAVVVAATTVSAFSYSVRNNKQGIKNGYWQLKRCKIVNTIIVEECVFCWLIPVDTKVELNVVSATHIVGEVVVQLLLNVWSSWRCCIGFMRLRFGRCPVCTAHCRTTLCSKLRES